MCACVHVCICVYVCVLCLYRGEKFERSLIHAVESVVVEWSHQVRDVLDRSSAQPLLQGTHPGPLVELDFWKARRADLESVVDQLCCEKVVKMSRLLEKTLSSYYPAYCSMVDSIHKALDEARDIKSVLCTCTCTYMIVE